LLKNHFFLPVIASIIKVANGENSKESIKNNNADLPRDFAYCPTSQLSTAQSIITKTSMVCPFNVCRNYSISQKIHPFQ
jgi:hypothetical protein